MANISFIDFPAIELYSFRTLCESHGHRRGEFLVSGQGTLSKPGRPPDIRTITVRHHETSTVRTYHGNASSDWLNEFERDLAKGVFGGRNI